MVSGEEAAAAGMDVVNGSTHDLRDGADEINKTRDYLARHQSTGTHSASSINSGVFDAARIPALDASKITAGILTTRVDTASQVRGGSIGVGATGKGFDTAGTVYANAAYADGPIFTPHGRNNPVGSWISAGIGTDGRIAVTASSRRFKKSIKDWAPDLQAVLAMQLVTYYYKVSLDRSGDLQVGLIAEQLHDLGLGWLVFYDEDGLPFGIHFERIALALLPVVQDHETRLLALEQRAA